MDVQLHRQVAFSFACDKAGFPTRSLDTQARVRLAPQGAGFVIDRIALTLKATIPWPVIIRSFTVIAAVNASLFILGTAFFQARESGNPYYIERPRLVKEAMAAFGEQTGRVYQPFDYEGHPEAERVIVLMHGRLAAAGGRQQIELGAQITL